MNSQQQSEALREITEYTSELLQNYSDDQISGEEVTGYLSLFEGYFPELNAYDEYTSNVRDLFETVRSVKEQLSNAERAETENDIRGALLYYEEALAIYKQSTLSEDLFPGSISELDGKIATMEADYKNGVINEAKSLAEQGDYISACSLLKENMQDMLSDDNDATSLLEEYCNTYAEMKAADEDFARAITFLQEITDDYYNSSLNSKLAEYEKKYRTQTIDQSIELYHSNGAEAANAAIVESLQLMPDDEQLRNVSDLYQSVMEPVPFKELTGQGNASLGGSDRVDSLGENHSSSNLIYYLNITKDNPKYMECNTYGKYSKLIGSMYFDDAVFDMSASMKIYADGVTIFESGPLNKKTGGVDFDVDITNAYSVKIEISYIEVGSYYSHCFLDNVYVIRELSDSEIREAALQ